jgi:hypothetical protein
MRIKTEVETDGCDYCSKPVSARSYCDWCHKHCCTEHGTLVLVRDYDTHEPTGCATRWVCIDCAKSIYKEVLDAEKEIRKLEKKIRDLKSISYEKMSKILHETIEHHRNDKNESA